MFLPRAPCDKLLVILPPSIAFLARICPAQISRCNVRQAFGKLSDNKRTSFVIDTIIQSNRRIGPFSAVSFSVFFSPHIILNNFPFSHLIFLAAGAFGRGGGRGGGRGDGKRGGRGGPPKS